MNFQSLKGMIESIIVSYKCPECSSEVNETNIDIIGAAGSTINIDIECFNCGKHSMIKTEILSLELSNKGLNQENIEKIKKSLIALNANLISKQSIIKDDIIVNLNKDLKKEQFNVTDLFGDNN
ncbi:MAG: hypothetical protein Q8K30_04695 [Candidatus Gracilibacteria bacterium]|nr:hypothetical protein [Candidatus Gracilibacteria bacterium]